MTATSDAEPLDLDAIKARANAATPGPWEPDEVHMLTAPTQLDGFAFPEERAAVEAHLWANYLHIAGIDPETTLALVAEVERLREERDMFREKAHRFIAGFNSVSLKLGAIAALADEWERNGHGEDPAHVDDPGCESCKFVKAVRAILADSAGAIAKHEAVDCASCGELAGPTCNHGAVVQPDWLACVHGAPEGCRSYRCGSACNQTYDRMHPCLACVIARLRRARRWLETCVDPEAVGLERKRAMLAYLDGVGEVPDDISVIPVAKHEQEVRAEVWGESDRRDVAAWLIREADQRVEFFPQRRDGVDALLRHLADIARADALTEGRA